jgi:hypothetical protein
VEALGEAGDCPGISSIPFLCIQLDQASERPASTERRAYDRRPGTGGRTTGRYRAERERARLGF